MPESGRCLTLGAFVAVTFLASCGEPPEAAPEPDLAPLHESLARAAAEAITEPVLASAGIRLRASAEQVAAQTGRVRVLATQLGGESLPPVEEGGATLVLVRLPAASLPEFFLTLTGSARPVPAGEATSLVEVLIGPGL